ncbi:hypothetical protein D9M72_518260 [compost metagenome]
MLGSIDLHQFTVGLAPQPRLMKRPPLLARQPQAGRRHPLAQGLARHRQTITLGKLLGRQRRSEVHIAFAHDRHRIIAHAVANPIVRGPADCLVPDRRCTASADPIQQTTYLARAQLKHARRRHQRHPTGGLFRQNLNPLRIALAHRNQSHPQSPRSSKPGESDIPTLQDQDTLTLRLHTMWRPG